MPHEMSEDMYKHIRSKPVHHIAQFLQEPPAATVPAVPAVLITRQQWETIKEVFAELHEIQSCSSFPLESSLIQGKIVARIIEKAQSIHLPE